MDFSLKLLTILFMIFCFVSGNKYSADKNKEDEDSPFRMMKVNLIWNKARLKLPKESLVKLYQDLKQQDSLEVELKKMKAAGQDEDGEFEALVTKKSLEVMLKHGLEHLDPNIPPTLDNNKVYEDRVDPQKWDNVMNDKKLSKLWKKAQLSGFDDKELAALRAELMHHMDKAEEINALHSGLNELDEGFDNTVAGHRDQQDRREQKVYLKNKHRELRESLTKLEDHIINSNEGLSDRIAGGFRHPKVIELWFSAKKSNFSDLELASIQEELRHFEHKIMKLEHLREQSETVESKVKQKHIQLSEYPEKHYKFTEKVKEYSQKVKKYETDLRERIGQASRHNEL